MKKTKKYESKLLETNNINKPSIIIDEPEEIINDLPNTEIDELEEIFNGGNTESSILKELFSGKNFKTKTEINDDEISIISRLYIMGKITKRPLINNILDEFLTLRISKNRQSRKEFVEAQKERQHQENKGLFGGLFGGGQQRI